MGAAWLLPEPLPALGAAPAPVFDGEAVEGAGPAEATGWLRLGAGLTGAGVCTTTVTTRGRGCGCLRTTVTRRL